MNVGVVSVASCARCGVQVTAARSFALPLNALMLGTAFAAAPAQMTGTP